MYHKKTLFVFFCTLIILCAKDTVYSQSKGRTVGLNEFITAYLSNSFDLKTQYETLRESRGNKLLVESQDDLTLSADAGYTGAQEIAKNTNLNMFTGSVGLAKKFSTTGTTLSVKDGFGFGGISSNKGSANQLSINAIQPVLKNFFGYLDRINIKQMALVVKSNEILYQKSIENNIMNAISLYLEWVRYYKQRQILKEIIANNEAVFRQTRAQLSAGIAEVSDLELSRISVIQYQKQLLSNQSDLESTILALSDYLPITQEDMPDIKVVETSLDFPNISANPNYIRSIRSMNYLLEQAQLGIDAARNQYLPSLDVVASFQWNSGLTEYLSSGSSGKTNFFIGAELSMPLFMMNARANEIVKIAQYEKILLQRDQAIRDILRTVKVYQSQLMVVNQSIVQQGVLVESYKRQVNSQNLQYRRGSLALENLITGRNNLSNAMLEEHNLKITAYQLYNQYLSLIDRILDEYKTSIPESIIIKDPEIA